MFVAECSGVRNRARSARMWGFGGTAPKKSSPCRTSALFRSRSVCSRRCDSMVCLVVVCRVCPHAVRPLFVAAASDPPTRTIGSSRRVSGRRPPRPEGVARAPAVTRVRTRPSAPCNEVSNTKCRFLLFCQQVLPLFTDGFGRLMAPRTRLDAKIGVSIQKNVPTRSPDPLSGLKVRESGIFSDFGPQLFSLSLRKISPAYELFVY